ncbi:hypothetical protein J2Y70_003864 [Xanthomonas translucens]|nr:hypothetical protein [Xanthomonas translucens]
MTESAQEKPNTDWLRIGHLTGDGTKHVLVRPERGTVDFP